MNDETKLIKALRCCIVDFNSTQSRLCNECPYRIYADGKKACENKAKRDAADALEAADKTVIPHRNYERCHIYWCDCGWFLKNKDETPNYCPNCGERIEWESVE